MLKTQEDVNYAYQKKKGINAERKEARLEKEEADKYARLKEDLVTIFKKNTTVICLQYFLFF